MSATADAARIVGIVLARDEEFYLGTVLRNIVPFCDHVIIADHGSTDDTGEIARQFAAGAPSAEYHFITDPRYSHDLLRKYAGRKVWIFGVDGDEIYDPIGLSILKKQITVDRYDRWWMILGNVMNCVEIDKTHMKAKGYLSPPCRSMTKLYNFHAISDWRGKCPERLHGGEILFKDGYHPEKRLEMQKHFAWEQSILRCLHLCFLPRSRKDKEAVGKPLVRENIADRNTESVFQKLKHRVFRKMEESEASRWKRKKYMRGGIVSCDIHSFFADADGAETTNAGQK